MKMLEAIIFDFDGVLVDSNHIKKNAYYIIFSKINDSKKCVREAIKENSEKTRYGVIEAILKKLKEKKLINIDDLGAEIEKYAFYYGEITEKRNNKSRRD